MVFGLYTQASWLGGSYIEDASGPLNGVLTVPMANGALLRLRMSEVSTALCHLLAIRTSLMIYCSVSVKTY